MDIQAMFEEFIGSEHGQQAAAAIGASGIPMDQVGPVLQHALQAGTDHVEQHHASSGLLGEHPGKSFLVAFAAGLVRGDGVFGAFKDGAEGIVTGRIGEALAERAGIDPGTASTVAAAVTPYIAGYLKQKFS